MWYDVGMTILDNCRGFFIRDIATYRPRYLTLLRISSMSDVIVLPWHMSTDIRNAGYIGKLYMLPLEDSEPSRKLTCWSKTTGVLDVRINRIYSFLLFCKMIKVISSSTCTNTEMLLSDLSLTKYEPPITSGIYGRNFPGLRFWIYSAVESGR